MQVLHFLNYSNCMISFDTGKGKPSNLFFIRTVLAISLCFINKFMLGNKFYPPLKR